MTASLCHAYIRVREVMRVDELQAAERFMAALATRDFEGVQDVLSPDVRFRALVPPGLMQDAGADAVVHRLRGWLTRGASEATELLSSEVGRVLDRICIRYRFRWRETPDSPARIFEQVAFCDVADGRLYAIDLLCTGDRLEPVPRGARHRFDAGDLGCADGLAEEFKRRLRAVEVGDVLEVVAGDPAAKEDLPSLARLMGHTVVQVESLDHGRLLISVEKTK